MAPRALVGRRARSAALVSGLLPGLLVSLSASVAVAAVIFPNVSNLRLAGASSVSLYGASCPVGGNCLGAGSFLGNNSDDNGPLLASDTTGGWKTSVAPLPAGALPGNSANSLASVSCASASSCTAVGAYKDAKGQSPLVVAESGFVRLASAAVTLPANGEFWDTRALVGVSCARAGQCVAVGDYEAGGGSDQGLGAVQSGGTWKATEVGFGGTSQLEAISCVASACLAIGHGVGQGNSPEALAVAESGGHFGSPFTVKAPTNSSGIATSLTSSSCTGPSTCTVVGSYEPTTTDLSTAMATGEVGGAWGRAVAIELPAGAPDNASSSLTGVSCSSSGDCDVALVVLSTGTHAISVPGPPTPSPASATTTPAVVAIGEGNNSTGVAYEGAAHALWFSWQTYGTSQWHPEEVAGPGTTYSAPSVGESSATSVSNNANAIAVEGPDNSLDYYWQMFDNVQWNKEVVATSNAAYSAPSLAEVEASNSSHSGLKEVNDIYVMGPDHSLVDWDQGLLSGGWQRSAIAGDGEAFSAPSAVDSVEISYFASDYNTQVAYEGPGDSLLYYWDDRNGSGTETVAGPGTTTSAPTIADGNNSTSVAAQGPGNSLAFYWQQTGTDDPWDQEPVAGSGSTYSVPAMAEGNNSASIVTEGPGKSVNFYWQTYGGASGWSPEAPSGKGSTN